MINVKGQVWDQVKDRAWKQASNKVQNQVRNGGNRQIWRQVLDELENRTILSVAFGIWEHHNEFR